MTESVDDGYDSSVISSQTAYEASANAKWMGISGLLLCALDCKH